MRRGRLGAIRDFRLSGLAAHDQQVCLNSSKQARVGLPIRRLRDFPPETACGVYPALDGVTDVIECLLRGLAVRNAVGEIGDGGEIAAAVVFMKRYHKHMVYKIV